MSPTGPKPDALWLARKHATAHVVTALLPAVHRAPLPLDVPLRVGYLRVDKRVGEVLLQTPIFHAHKAARPQDTVVAIVHPGMVRVLKEQPHLDLVLPFCWRGFPVLGSARALWHGLRQLKLDVVVDCGDPSLLSLGHLLAARSVHARWRIGFARGPAASQYTHPVEVPAALHEASARAALLQPFNITAPPTLKWVPHPASLVQVGGEDVVALMGAQKGMHAVVCPGGRLAWRRGGPAHFGAAARVLQQSGRTVWLAPGPGEQELVAQVLALAPECRVLPNTDLDQLGAVMAAAGLTVCNNSGTMHLSVAVAAPTFALFVHMDPTRWGHGLPHRMHVVEGEESRAIKTLTASLQEWQARA